jgi:hypothetical protein
VYREIEGAENGVELGCPGKRLLERGAQVSDMIRGGDGQSGDGDRAGRDGRGGNGLRLRSRGLVEGDEDRLLFIESQAIEKTPQVHQAGAHAQDLGVVAGRDSR